MKPERFTGVIFLCVVMGFMILAFLAIALKAKELTDATRQKVKIEWEKIYPFNDCIKEASESSSSKILSLCNLIKDKLENYTSKKMPGYYGLVEAARKYENVLGWNIAAVYDYNAVVKLKDGYLTTYAISLDVTHDAEAVKTFADFCTGKGIDFAYINFPAKICKSDDVSGVLDFTNQNADKFLAKLKESGVRNYDFRKNLHAAGMNHHESFYITDHHWKTETGLWAAGEILKILRDDLGYDVDTEILSPGNFEYVTYYDWFLGSQGKKVTHVRTKPDNFTMIYPKFAVSLRFEVPGLGLNVSGDFSIMYNMKEVETKDFYGKNPHNTYMYGRQPFLRIENRLTKNKNAVLIIYDSFSNSVIPFLSLGLHRIYAIDLRQFSGSLRTFIATFKPDAVIVEYNSLAPGGLNDFR